MFMSDFYECFYKDITVLKMRTFLTVKNEFLTVKNEIKNQFLTLKNENITYMLRLSFLKGTRYNTKIAN